jgi:hypothetical protein
MSTQFQRTYGLTHNLFAFRKPNSTSLIIGGDGNNGDRWTRVLSGRAASLLWYKLGLDLFPEAFDNLSASISTVGLRGSDAPSITTDLRLEKLPTNDVNSCDFEIIGRNGALSWSARMNNENALRLWEELDVLLDIKRLPEGDLDLPDADDVIRLE